MQNDTEINPQELPHHILTIPGRVQRELSAVIRNGYGDIMLMLDGDETWQFIPHQKDAATPDRNRIESAGWLTNDKTHKKAPIAVIILKDPPEQIKGNMRAFPPVTKDDDTSPVGRMRKAMKDRFDETRRQLKLNHADIRETIRTRFNNRAIALLKAELRQHLESTADRTALEDDRPPTPRVSIPDDLPGLLKVCPAEDAYELAVNVTCKEQDCLLKIFKEPGSGEPEENDLIKTLAPVESASPTRELEAEIIRALNSGFSNDKARPTASEFYHEYVIQSRTMAGLERAKGWKLRTMRLRKARIETYLFKKFGVHVDLDVFRNVARKSGKIIYTDPKIIEETHGRETPHDAD